jgi:hypothetical protein
MKATLLKPLYTKAVKGLPLLGTPADVARRFREEHAPLETASDRLVTHYARLGGSVGFVGGLPGFLLMPVTLPANIAGVALLQLHMTAALAVMGGHDVHHPATRDRCIGCLLEKLDESGENSEEEEVASRTGIKLVERGVRLLAAQAAKAAGRAARNVLLRRVGGRWLPLVGGALGAGTDMYMTRHVGQCAKASFLVP